MNVEFKGKTIILTSADGLLIKADVYEAADPISPVILLFHQAGFSRGEYRSIAPQLDKLGFTCIAIDQRSGNEVNGVENDTYKEALKLRKGTEYSDALPDLEAAITYARKAYSSRKIILWGSSYAAALVFMLGKEYSDVVSAIVAFSPGEYFEYQNRKIKDYAREITSPVFVSSSRDEYKSWEGIYKSIPGDQKMYYLPDNGGTHGSKALWAENAGNKLYWAALEKFLNSLKKK